MTTIRLNVCGNDEVLGVENIDFQDALDEARDVGEFLEVQLRTSFAYWNGGPGYGHGQVAVEVLGFGTVKNEEEAKEAVAWMANYRKEFPSSAEIEAAFEAKHELQEAIDEAIQKKDDGYDYNGFYER